MSNIERLMDVLRVRIPGATDAALKLELRQVADDFCQETNVWREEIPVTAVPGQREYPLIPEGQSSVVRLLSVINGSGFPVRASMPVPGDLLLMSEPTATTDLVATVAMTIPDAETRDGYPVMPEWVWGRYSDTIIDGVQARMFSQIAKPYSNERMAIYHMRRYSGLVSKARAEGRHENTYSVQRWQYPQTFAVQRK
jgi:hypothetical protein